MPLYTYVAIDSNGTRVKDNYNAENKQEVIKYIRDQNLFAMSITEAGAEAKSKDKIDIK